MTPPPSVVVVGAGLAGLAAAVHLKACGAEVRVFDPDPPGGKARTVVQGDWRYEWGPHFLTHRADAVFALAQELKVADRLELLGKKARRRYLVRNGALVVAGPAALSFGELFGLGTGLFKKVPLGEDDTVRDFAAQRFGESVADGPVDAFLNGVWAASPAEVAMESAFPTIAALVREHGSMFAAMRQMPKATRASGTYAFAEGMGALGDAARVHLGERAFVRSTVDSLARAADGGWLLGTDGGQVRADAVVIATPAPAAAALLAELAPAAAQGLRSIRYSPIAAAHWTSPDAAFRPGFGWLAPAREQRKVLGTLFVGDLVPARMPAGQRGFTSMFGGSRRPEDAEIDAQEMGERIRREHLDFTGRPVTIASLEIVRHPRAVPLPEPGHARRTAAIHAALPAGLALAGAWCGAGALNDAAHAGKVASANLWKILSPGRTDAT